MGNSQPKHAPKHKRRSSKEHRSAETNKIHEISSSKDEKATSKKDVFDVTSIPKPSKSNATNNNNNNNNNTDTTYKRDNLINETNEKNSQNPLKVKRPMSLVTIPEDKQPDGESDQQLQQQRSKSVSAGTSSFREYQRHRKTSKSSKDQNDKKMSSCLERSDSASRNSRNENERKGNDPKVNESKANEPQGNKPGENGRLSNNGTSSYDYRTRAASMSSAIRTTQRSPSIERSERTRSKSFTALKSKDKKTAIDDNAARINSVNIRTHQQRPRSNSEVKEFRRRSLPVQLQKKLRKETLLSSSRLSLRPESRAHRHRDDHTRLRVPFHYPLNKKLLVKLIPLKDSKGTSSVNGLLKHIVFARIENQDRKLISKTGQLYKASVLFTEGRLKDVTNKQTGMTSKRLVQAQIWSGVSRTVDFEDEAIQVTGNFMSRAKGMISFLEFDLVLKPNFKNKRSADTGAVLFAVGTFTFKDTRSAVNKAIQWSAVVENWRKHGTDAEDDVDSADELGWTLPCEDDEYFDGQRKKTEHIDDEYDEEEWNFLFLQ